VHLKSISLINFRNYQKSKADLSPGVNIFVGGNGAGKSNILEAVQYGCCGRSFRTSREAEMVMAGEGFFRLDAELITAGHRSLRSVTYEAGSGPRVEAGSGPRWVEAAAMFSFSPDDLQLVKGPPANRRRFLDDSVGLRVPAHQKLVRDYSQVLAQRNRFLQRAATGQVPLADISPWDRQMAALSVKITAARQEHCRKLAPYFQSKFVEIAGGGDPPGLRMVTQLEEALSGPEPEVVLERMLERGWLADMERQGSGTGSHRDDLEVMLEGKSLRRYGSQGEQRAAVLALLLAGCELARLDGGPEPILLLDDVMSELEPSRRRRLMTALGAGDGQALVTAADKALFTEEELGAARVFEVISGAVSSRERSLA
jgi:DNA replication and repair protein RecF